jgi:signal transduction histidine kinase
VVPDKINAERTHYLAEIQGAAAHSLRVPVAAVSLFAELLKERDSVRDPTGGAPGTEEFQIAKKPRGRATTSGVGRDCLTPAAARGRALF